MTDHLTIPIVITLWYCLGVISISTTKILLRDWYRYGLTPLLLTLQQFIIGWQLLGFIVTSRRRHTTSHGESRPSTLCNPRLPWNIYQLYNFRHVDNSIRTTSQYLLLSSICFTMGFFATNLGFQLGHANFVETVKASEPMTSAWVAALWGIETLNKGEIGSLLVICMGVVMSTIGNTHSNGNLSGLASATTHHAVLIPKYSQSITTSLIVLTSNLCFSFRGLYQKLYRSTACGHVNLVNDGNLQYRMQLSGIWLLGACCMVAYLPQYLWKITQTGDWSEENHGESHNKIRTIVIYIGLSVINGMAFTGYNLASTFVLSRISVVQHAALNCIRRLFSIIITSIVFGVPITFIAALGIVMSIGGFMSFTHFKYKQLQPHTCSTTSILPQ